MERIDCAVIGAGVVGLAIARALALSGREVVVLESQGAIGTGISSRNSEVIHAGMHFATGSLKARFCVAGNAMLRAFAASHNVPFRMVGKLIVAVNADEERALAELYRLGNANGVAGLELISGVDAMRMEPELHCAQALYSPNSGIVDVHSLMLALRGDAEAHGAVIALKTPVEDGRSRSDGVLVRIGGPDATEILAKTVVIAAGLDACRLGRAFALSSVPTPYLCKGNYFALTGKPPFRRLIYPIPETASLGVHYTCDLSGQGRFGPDAEWIETENYDVDPNRAGQFYRAIGRYWPAIANRTLEPAYSGIRPKIHAQGTPRPDFRIAGPGEHGAAGIIALYGIESPGLTSSLAIADHVRDLAASL
ncbi:MAG TPA: NAD(P)/FAD-dependent oxidoreductase [Micropepsaceae bacterium]|jgi:L-2-hydroxyglutarate oxidase LhgO